MFTKPILTNGDITRFKPYPGIADLDADCQNIDQYIAGFL
jgi:hypothetical protein